MIEPARPSEPAPRAAVPTEPMTGPEFTVRLERVFQGPLDLLLQLVRERELEIHVVALARVCDEYCAHVRSLEHVDVDEAADYLVLAATLLAIKSRSLLPQDEIEAEEDPFEPGEELVQQLLTYKALREVAEEMHARLDTRSRLLQAGGRWRGKVDAPEEEEEEWDLGDVSLWDLLRVFRRLETETGFNRPHRIPTLGKPLRIYVEEVWQRLQVEPASSLHEIARGQKLQPHDAAYYLVALLELAKQQAVDLEQTDPFGDIAVRRVKSGGELNLGQLDEAFDESPDELEPELEDLLAGTPSSDSSDPGDAGGPPVDDPS
jgi:segregation and condensation protein A